MRTAHGRHRAGARLCQPTLTPMGSAVLRLFRSWHLPSPPVVAAPSRRARVVARVRCRRPAGEKP